MRLSTCLKKFKNKMKRSHEPSFLQSFSKEGESANDNTKNIREKFVAKWILDLPEPMHRIKKQSKMAIDKFENGDDQKKQPKPAVDFNFNRMGSVSELHHTEVENVFPVEDKNDSNKVNNIKLNESLLNLTLAEGNNIENDDNGHDKVYVNDDAVDITDSELSFSSWETIEFESLKVFNLVEYPSNVVIYGKSFPELTKIDEKSLFKISTVQSVGSLKFWFIIEENRKNWKPKLDEMNRVYNAMKKPELKMNATHVFKGQICAAPLDTDWARGIIQSYLIGSTVKVFLVDFGIRVRFAPTDLKYLKSEFMNVPRLALRGSVAFIKPTVPLASDKLFYKYICLHSHMARLVQVKKLGEKAIFELDIYNRNLDVNVAQMLIQKGLAVYKEKYVIAKK